MHLKNKTIKGKRYIYAAKSIRLPDGKIVKLEKIYRRDKNAVLEEFFRKKEIEEHIKYAIKKYNVDYILTEEEIRKIEEIKFNYKKILLKLTKASKSDLFNRFTANFTYENNAIEGNSLTLKDVNIVIFENASIKGKNLREIYETRNSREVIGLINKNNFDISHEDIIKMHKILVKDTDIQIGYKKFPNVIMGKNIQTTPPEKVYGEMEKLIAYYHEHKEKIHPLQLAAVFHGRFEQIHPFEDGNGRVGRFLINVILLKNKYPPLIIRKSQRIAYISALEAFDKNHEEKLVRLILEKFKHTYKNFFEVYVKYIK